MDNNKPAHGGGTQGTSSDTINLAVPRHLAGDVANSLSANPTINTVMGQQLEQLRNAGGETTRGARSDR
jgi:hypothetical protein